MNDILCGVCTFLMAKHSLLTKNNQYQLRGMGILETHQGKGIGKLLLQHGERFLKEKKVQVVWCNARETAVDFYKKNNYNIIGNAFEIKDIGLHFTMYKSI